MIWLLALQLWAAPDPTAKVFADNQVAVRKVERLRGETVYTVDLPFDPMIGQNSTKLEAELAEALDCRDFTLVSSRDKLRIRIAARRSGKECMIKEVIEEMR